MAGTVKLKDIADALDISIVSVSNALSGKKGVSSEVRRRVLEKAEELGYNTAKYDQGNEKNFTIGVIVSENYIDVEGSFYWALYQKIAFAASKRQGFTMLEIVKMEEEEELTFPNLMRETGVGGLIIVGKMKKEYIKMVIHSSKMPVILVDYYSEELACDSVMSCNYLGMYKMTHYLTSRGHREIAYVGETITNENLCDRYFGYCKGLAECGIEVRPDWVIAEPDVVRRKMEVTLPEQMPTAFVCCSDLTAGELYNKLTASGYRVPEDISIVGYDNYLFEHPFAGQLTTYNVDIQEMAETAIRILVKKIRGDRKFMGVRYLDSYIVERGSVKSMG